MESALSFLHSLQLADSFFPVGAFAYSDGLETAAAAGLVHDGETLSQWMDHFIDAVFVPCEGLALLRSMAALQANDLETLRAIDEELTAIRPSASVRAASAGVGKRLLSLYASISKTDSFPALTECNAAAAYAIVFHHRGVEERDALLAFGYNRLTGVVSAALRLITIGHQQGQILLTQKLERLPVAVDRILGMKNEPLRSFSPMLDIQQMNHQHLYSKLFRS